MPISRPLLRAYVDETGDRGTSGKSSPFFAFACALVADEDEAALRSAMSKLRAELRVPQGKALHWNEHAKKFSRRQHITGTLAALSDLRVNYVLVEKNAIPASAGMRTDQVIFYNFAAALMLERILLAARSWPGGSRDVIIKFGHVRGFNHVTTTDYFNLRRAAGNPPCMPWSLQRGTVKFDGPAHWDGLQAADQYAGMLSSAIRRDEFGNYEPQHFLRVSEQIRRDQKGNAWNYGWKLLGNRTTLESLPWWPQTNL